VRVTEAAARSGIVAIVGICALGFSPHADAQIVARNTLSTATDPRITIENFGCVGPNYYRGAQPIGRDYVDLGALGIKAVINLASDDADPREPAMVEASGMKYFQLPMTTHQTPTSERLAEFLSLVTDPANQPVFVHCVGGRHRTGVMTAVYRMTQDRWTAAQAFEEMKRYKFGADYLHREFKDFVYRYGASIVHASGHAAPVLSKTGG
jgi:tyrosine-protein phosphatase SIW14